MTDVTGRLKHILRGKIGQWRTTGNGEVEAFIQRQEQRGSFGRSTWLTRGFQQNSFCVSMAIAILVGFFGVEEQRKEPESNIDRSEGSSDNSKSQESQDHFDNAKLHDAACCVGVQKKDRRLHAEVGPSCHEAITVVEEFLPSVRSTIERVIFANGVGSAMH
ncbi:hypothetical protein MRS44_002883 [Fusarium solani]|jgi:hypothetical protein|uniref:Uncharacterized protein n=1 Tax=Fusarium solani TaxID=169388 RepID=A0A9P9RAG9_FUSSL|nr:uncharacterized protein B0J15DRAFT_460128 [Fusarium solani]KAH7272376.1 hypothetical protein B0J15DRAFT_460128 [Fusarium solani]KAJ3468818.1 hypothetical protein MRS44_002883 [Fusarium solani]